MPTMITFIQSCYSFSYLLGLVVHWATLHPYFTPSKVIFLSQYFKELLPINFSIDS